MAVTDSSFSPSLSSCSATSIWRQEGTHRGKLTMIRYFTFAFVLLAMLLASTITHAQQGNLPVPMQKLPSYPPVVCVAPNWTPVSCASRTPTYGPQNELSGWQCGNVRVIMSSDSTIPSLEFLITGTEQRDNRFKLVKGEKLYLNGKLCTSFPEHNKTESLPPYPPVTCLKLDGTPELCENRNPAPPPADEQAVKCLKPDGTEQPCASRQSYFEPAKRYDAEGLEKLLPPPFGPTNKTFLGGERGGRIDQHIERWKALAASGDDVEIRGFCWSACTLVTAYIPKERLCFSVTAVLAFHLARFLNGEPSIEGSRQMFNAYPEDIRAWLRAKGGLEKMPLKGFWLMFPSELWQMGYRDCDKLGSIPGNISGTIWKR